MQKTFLLLSVCLFLFITVFSCSTDDDSSPDTNTPSDEFVATQADFNDFKNWAVVNQFDTVGDPGGIVHSTGKRTIKSNTANPAIGSDGEFPKGTIILKEVESGGKIVAQVKRGGNFDPDHNNWEWFNLDNNGVITQRGSSTNMSICTDCHRKPDNIDYTFTIR